MSQQNGIPTATAGQPGVTIPADVYNTMVAQGLAPAMPGMAGQPTQQIFEQPQMQPPPASTMQAMQQQGQNGWVAQSSTIRPQAPSFAAQMVQPQQQAAQQQQAGGIRQELPGEVREFIERMSNMFNNNNQQQMQQQQGQPQGPGFFDTTWGKVSIGAGGIGVGIIGHKIFSGIFSGGSNNSGCSMNDAAALGNAFKFLFK